MGSYLTLVFINICIPSYMINILKMRKCVQDTMIIGNDNYNYKYYH